MQTIPSWSLYGEDRAFPDVLHCEKIVDRASGLDWVIAPHRHPLMHQFLFMRSGSVDMRVEGERQTPQPPFIANIPKGLVHEFRFSAGTDGYVITIPLQNLPEIFDVRAQTMDALGSFFMIDATPQLVQLCDGLHTEHTGNKAHRTEMLKALAVQLCCTIVRALPAPTRTPTDRHNPRFQHFADLVQSHFKDRWSLADYAQKLSITIRHLGRICHEGAGMAPGDYVESVLMREACRQLVYTRNSVAKISYELGYEDPSYFSRAFRRHMGRTPSQYRRHFDPEEAGTT